MITTVFRVCGDDFDVRSFLSDFRLEVIRSWEKGEIDPVTKRVSNNSGFNMDICNEGEYPIDYDKHVQKTIEFMKQNSKYLERLNAIDSVEMEVDIGIVDSDSFSIQARFWGEILELASKYNIELVVTVYPGEEDEE